MSACISSFIDSYYHIEKFSKLNLESTTDIPTGKFDRYTLGVSFSGLDSIFLEKAKKTIANIEKEKNSLPDDRLPVGDLIKIFPELKTLIIGQELLSHEYFHLLQTLTLPPAYALYKSSRELASLKVMTFLLLLQSGGKLDLDKGTSLFEYIEKNQDETFRNHLNSLFDIYKQNLDLIQNFFDYKEKSSRLNVVDLVEGAAYSFQKLLNRSKDVETFITRPDSPYQKASCFFKEPPPQNLWVEVGKK